LIKFRQNAEILKLNHTNDENLRFITKYLELIKTLSQDNDEFREELGELNLTHILLILNKPNIRYWIKFGKGLFQYGQGEFENGTVTISCPSNIIVDIIKGKTNGFKEFLNGRSHMEGNLQYAVVFFDLLTLASEILSEKGVFLIE